MKKVLIILSIIILVIIILGSIAFNKINKNLQSLEQNRISMIDLTSLEDGVYVGAYCAFPVKVKVEVLLKEHRIEDIKILEHVNGKGKPAEEIVKAMIEKQSIDVDVIAGAI